MLRSYLTYLLRRKNAFRIHSPFVYTLYTRYIHGGDLEALKELCIDRTEVLEEGMPSRVDPLVMYVMEGIHGGRKKEALWDTICGLPDVSLTIDLYDRGLVFCREGMEKQHFILKK